MKQGMALNILLYKIIIQNILFIFIFKSKKKKIEEEQEEAFKHNLLCRFVLDGSGNKVGESVAVDDDLLIIKAGKKYLGVPITHIEQEEKTLLVKGLVKQDKAEEMGERWRQESFKEIKYSDDE
jgi:hypothetical protein